MFSDPADPPDVLAARATETAEMRRWVTEANAKNGNKEGQALDPNASYGWSLRAPKEAVAAADKKRCASEQ